MFRGTRRPGRGSRPDPSHFCTNREKLNDTGEKMPKLQILQTSKQKQVLLFFRNSFELQGFGVRVKRIQVNQLRIRS